MSLTKLELECQKVIGYMQPLEVAQEDGKYLVESMILSFLDKLPKLRKFHDRTNHKIVQAELNIHYGGYYHRKFIYTFLIMAKILNVTVIFKKVIDPGSDYPESRIRMIGNPHLVMLQKRFGEWINDCEMVTTHNIIQRYKKIGLMHTRAVRVDLREIYYNHIIDTLTRSAIFTNIYLHWRGGNRAIYMKGINTFISHNYKKIGRGYFQLKDEKIFRTDKIMTVYSTPKKHEL